MPPTAVEFCWALFCKDHRSTALVVVVPATTLLLLPVPLRLCVRMGKDEEAPRFVPLVRDSFVVREDGPWLPDDIELVHEKHQRVLRSWEEKWLDDISLTVPSTPDVESFHDDECNGLSEMQKTRRRTVALVSCFCFVCVAAIGVVFVTARLGFGGRTQPSPPVSAPRPPPAPSDAPTERPTNDLLSEVVPATGIPTLSPSQVTDNGTGVSTTPEPSNRTKAEMTSIPVKTASPTESRVVAPPTPEPTIEITDDLIPLVDSLGIDDDETVAPSLESSSISTQMESLPPTKGPSSSPTVVAEASPGITPVPSSSRVCNGLASNCNQRVNELMFATVNNAMSSQEDGFYGPDNEYRLEEALVAGFRGLVLESCDCGAAEIQFCSSHCFSGTRNPARVVSNLVDFLGQEENANEVIILLIKVGDQSLLRLFSDIVAEVPELPSLLYQHPGAVGTEWPVLNDLIDSNKRLIIFQHGDLDCSMQYACPEGIHNTFSYMYETRTDLTGSQELLDSNMSLTVQNGSNSSDFFILNHYSNGASGTASIETAGFENSLETIQQRLTACRQKFGRDPSLLVVNFWNVGATLLMVNRRNRVLGAAASDGGQR